MNVQYFFMYFVGSLFAFGAGFFTAKYIYRNPKTQIEK